MGAKRPHSCKVLTAGLAHRTVPGVKLDSGSNGTSCRYSDHKPPGQSINLVIFSFRPFPSVAKAHKKWQTEEKARLRRKCKTCPRVYGPIRLGADEGFGVVAQSDGPDGSPLENTTIIWRKGIFEGRLEVRAHEAAGDAALPSVEYLFSILMKHFPRR